MQDVDKSVWEQRHAQNCAVGACKTEVDIERYRTVLDTIRPTLVVELGTWNGRSALFFANNGAEHVITVDITAGALDPIAVQKAGDRVTWITGSTTSPAIIRRVAIQAAAIQALGGHTMVVCDSDHSAPHVAAEMAAYGPMVTVGSYMVVEDGIVRFVPEQWPYYDGSPLDAIEAWVAGHPQEWEVDARIEAMFPTTQFPMGFLRRLR